MRPQKLRIEVVEVMGIDTLVVRPATMADLDSVARLADVPDARDRLHTLLADPTRLILLAEFDGRAVGMAEAQFYGVALRRAFGVTRLHDLAVDESFRRRGIGGALLDAVELWASAIPECRYLEWQSSPSAVPFYESRGPVANEHQDLATHPYFDIEFEPGEPRPR